MDIKILYPDSIDLNNTTRENTPEIFYHIAIHGKQTFFRANKRTHNYEIVTFRYIPIKYFNKEFTKHEYNIIYSTKDFTEAFNKFMELAFYMIDHYK